MRTFTFDNIDVLLGQHPGVALEAVQEKFGGQGSGGYCFEHRAMFAAALEQLGTTSTGTSAGWATRTSHCAPTDDRARSLDGQRCSPTPASG